MQAHVIRNVFFSFLLTIAINPTITKPENDSFFSPSYYINFISDQYNAFNTKVWNTFIGKQITAVIAKLSAAQISQEKWNNLYQKKLSSAKSPITDPILSSNKFRASLKNAALKFKGPLYNFAAFPEDFLFGASSSSYQYEGGLDEWNANAQFYIKKGLPPAGDAIDFWNRYDGDIKQMKKELGINSLRLSIAWERIEQTQGNYQQEALDTYATIIQALKENNIEPIIVLHHYTIPIWFQDIGGFEKRENNKHFVEYAKKIYGSLYKHVKYWSTFNAIEGYAFKGYRQGDGPPGIVNNMKLTQQVMAHMLDAHVQVYQELKQEYNILKKTDDTIPEPRIGIQKNIVPLDPAPNNNPFKKTASAGISVIGEGAQNKGFFDFFTTGAFNVYTPKRVYLANSQARSSIDWIGLNIYSNMFMNLASPEKEESPQYLTENPNYRDYPEGIYRAAEIINKRIAQPLNIPIIITENGIATKNDKDGNTKRTHFFQRTLYVIRKLIEEGYPIIGYTPWASHDNYEWPSDKSEIQKDPYSRPYGFFHVNFDKKSSDHLKRTLKPGAHYYRDFIKNFFNPKAMPLKLQTNNRDTYHE